MTCMFRADTLAYMSTAEQIIKARRAMERAERRGQDLAAARHRDWLAFLSDAYVIHGPEVKPS